MLSLSYVRARRLSAIVLLGFASGIPLALTGQAMQAWLTTEGLDLASIGFLGLVAMPYALKFLWAPLLDRFEPPWLGRRRGWLVSFQLLLALVLWLIAQVSPIAQPVLFASLAVCISFFSASQDIVFDAWRTDVLPAEDRGLGSSLMVASYRAAMVMSGGVAFIWAEQWGSWAAVYQTMAWFMLAAAVLTVLFAERYERPPEQRLSAPGRELRAFLTMLAGVVVSVWLARAVLIGVGLDPNDANKWIQLLFLLSEIALALPTALWLARRFGFDTLNHSLDGFFSRPGAWSLLALIVLYKLGDAFAGSLTTPFLLRELQFTSAEVGIVNKIMGLGASIVGALTGGVLMLRLGLYRSLLWFGLLQLLTNFGFLWLAVAGRNALGSFELPPFDILIASLDHRATIDGSLALVIFAEQFAAGLGTAAFLALLTGLSHSQFSATQFALLSALGSVGRVYVSPVSGVLAPAIGWPLFFAFTAVMAIPGLLMLIWMRRRVEAVGAA